jgi:hypothetical protein
VARTRVVPTSVMAAERVARTEAVRTKVIRADGNGKDRFSGIRLVTICG